MDNAKRLYVSFLFKNIFYIPQKVLFLSVFIRFLLKSDNFLSFKTTKKTFHLGLAVAKGYIKHIM